MNKPAPLARQVRAWRARWSLDRRAAAVALGVSWRTLEKWELSTRTPRGLALEALQTKLQSPPES